MLVMGNGEILVGREIEESRRYNWHCVHAFRISREIYLMIWGLQTPRVSLCTVRNRRDGEKF